MFLRELIVYRAFFSDLKFATEAAKDFKDISDASTPTATSFLVLAA
jgi:hypothetical protein